MTSTETFANVFLPLPLENSFTYLVPPSLTLTPFQRVLVPFRNKKMIGIVGDLHTKRPSLKVKEIEAKVDDKPLFSPSYFEWISWAARYYMTPVGAVLDAAIPSPLLDPRGKKTAEERSSREEPLSGHWSDTKEIVLSPQ